MLLGQRVVARRQFKLAGGVGAGQRHLVRHDPPHPPHPPARLRGLQADLNLFPALGPDCLGRSLYVLGNQLLQQRRVGDPAAPVTAKAITWSRVNTPSR